MKNLGIVLSIGIILMAQPLAKTLSFQWVGSLLIRLLLLLFVAYEIQQGPMEGLLAFLAVISLLVERNHQVLKSFPQQAPKLPSKAGNQGRPFSILPEHDEVVHMFEPAEVKDENNALELEDSIPRIPEVPHGETAATFYEEKGLV